MLRHGSIRTAQVLVHADVLGAVRPPAPTERARRQPLATRGGRPGPRCVGSPLAADDAHGLPKNILYSILHNIGAIEDLLER